MIPAYNSKIMIPAYNTLSAETIELIFLHIKDPKDITAFAMTCRTMYQVFLETIRAHPDFLNHRPHLQSLIKNSKEKINGRERCFSLTVGGIPLLVLLSGLICCAAGKGCLCCVATYKLKATGGALLASGALSSPLSIFCCTSTNEAALKPVYEEEERRLVKDFERKLSISPILYMTEGP